MKKILAIALAVAMVLTMASAFAWDWSWTCPTTADKTGKVAVEVIPYVKVNNGCGGYDWVQSNCAGTVASENVYFLVKLTVDKDINPVWYKHITETQGVVLSTTKGGFSVTSGTTITDKVAYKATVAMPATSTTLLPTDTSKDGWTFYLNPTAQLKAAGTSFDGIETAANLTGAWVETAENDLTVTDYMFGLKVANASKAKVCAKLTSDFDGMGEWLTYGDYKILVTPNGTAPATLTIIPSCIATAAVSAANATADTATATGITGGTSEKLTLTITDGKVWVANAVGATSCTGTFANNALNFFGIQLGTCVNADNIRANFGWKDKVESCFTWSGNATAIVDVQCEVEIPKTGDVSVIAYAVMAVVAAAGAMGLKK